MTTDKPVSEKTIQFGNVLGGVTYLNELTGWNGSTLGPLPLSKLSQPSVLGFAVNMIFALPKKRSKCSATIVDLQGESLIESSVGWKRALAIWHERTRIPGGIGFHGTNF